MLSEIPIEIPYRRLRLVHKIPPVLNGKSKYILIQKQEQASEMPNDAKHHASVLACKDAQLGDSDVHTI